jgi:hypothetical protein
MDHAAIFQQRCPGRELMVVNFCELRGGIGLSFHFHAPGASLHGRANRRTNVQYPA